MIDITQPLMRLLKDGVEISRHTSAVEAMERAGEHGPGEYTLVRPDATIVVDGEQPAPDPEPTPDLEPEPTPEPEPEPPVEPTPDPEPTVSLLADEAATMQAGEWRNIADKTTWPGKESGTDFYAFQKVGGTTTDGAGGADGIGWTQRLVYHEGELMILAMRDQAPVSLMHMHADGMWTRKDSWRKIGGEWVEVNEITGWEGSGWSGSSGGRRAFNRLTSDSEHMYFSRTHGTEKEQHGRTYRTPLDNPGHFEDSGHEGFGQSNIDTVGNHAILWVEEWGRFYAYTPSGYVYTREPSDAGWTQLGRTPYYDGSRASGYAGEIAYNPVLNELVFIGGQSFGSPPGTGTKWARITSPLGEIEALPDLPEIDGLQLYYTSANGKIFVDPRDGAYLLQVHRRKVFYTRDHQNWAEYTDLYDDAGKPFWNYDSYAPVALIPGTDVFVFVSHGRGVVLHRLKPLEDMPDPVASEPEPEPEPAPEPDPVPTPDPEPAPEPTPGPVDPSGSVLATQAAALQPGAFWFPLGLETFPGVWTYDAFASNSSDFWNPVAVWNPAQQRMYGVLDRTAGPHTEESAVIVYYDAGSDEWGNVEMPNMGGDFGSPHVYGAWAFDLGRQKAYRRQATGDLWVLDLASLEWTNTGSSAASWNHGIAVHEGLGEVVYLDRSGNVLAWNPDTDTVRTLGQNPDMTKQHSHAHYNAVRDEVCIAFGDGGNHMTLVAADGTVTPVTVPAEVRAGQGSSTTFTFYDPITGHYLVYATDPKDRNARRIWEYDPDADEWREALNLWESHSNFPPYHGHLIAPVPEHGVVIWLHRSDYGDDGRHQRIYKHRSAFE